MDEKQFNKELIKEKNINNFLLVIIIFLILAIVGLILFIILYEITLFIDDKNIETDYIREDNYYTHESVIDDSDDTNIIELEEDLVNNSLVSGNNGDKVFFEGYKWHIIGQDDNRIILLMDDFQLSKMSHCTIDLDFSTDCGVSGDYYQYSWDKSKIRTYLNTTFLNSLSTDTKNNLIPSEVCKNGTIYSNDEYSYGGYTKEEIELLDETCESGYTSDYVRLISVSEYHNLSKYFENSTYPAISIYDNGKGLIPKLDYITRTEDNDWLYVSCYGGSWWTMGTLSSNSGPNYTKIAYYAECGGGLSYYNGEVSLNVRPVIVLKK